MELYGTLDYENRFEKVWILKIKSKDGKYWTGDFIKRKDLNYLERKNGIKTKDNKYVYSFKIESAGVYKTHNIDGIDEKYKTRYCFIDPKKQDGVVISASLIEEILNNKLEDIDKVKELIEKNKKIK
jgi:hypothetical protein